VGGFVVAHVSQLLMRHRSELARSVVCGECGLPIELGHRVFAYFIIKKKLRVVDVNGVFGLSQSSDFEEKELLLCKDCDRLYGGLR